MDGFDARDDACIDPSWKRVLASQFSMPYMAKLRGLLASERAAGQVVYPSDGAIFAAFDRTPFDRVRVVIVGQDPYHGPGQAMGLSFSVPRGTPQPPSLRNIIREVEEDVGAARPLHGDLSSWADQGVLLLNTTLSVRAGEAASHAGSGWEQFTSAALRAVDTQREGVVFLLWGSHARRAGAAIDRDRHLVLESPHPSPLSASRGFFGCRHFSRANAYLVHRGDQAIDWSLPE